MHEPEAENPFASPGVVETSVPVAKETPPPSSNRSQLATRRQRLHATLLDGIFMLPFMMIVGTSVYVAGEEWGFARRTLEASILPRLIFGGLMIIPFAIFNGYMLHTQGQTFGKWLCRIAIVTDKGRIPQIYDLLFARYLPIWLFIFVPYLNILCLIDVVWIFVS